MQIKVTKLFALYANAITVNSDLGKTFSRSKYLFYILPLKGALLQCNSFRRTHHAIPRTCETPLMILTTRLTTRSTRSTHLSIRTLVYPPVVLVVLSVGFFLTDPLLLCILSK